MKTLVAFVALSALATWFIFWVNADSNCTSCHRSATSSRKLVLMPEGSPPPSVPGDPENAVRDFRVLYRAMIAYRDVHGRLPSPNELRDTSRPLVPGIQLRPDDHTNSDVFLDEYKGSNPVKKQPTYTFSYRAPRANGQRKPQAPKAGERDVWFQSSHYERVRALQSDGGLKTERYGVKVGLFSDGAIEVVPLEKMLAISKSADAYQMFFPGEAGVPASARPVNELGNELLRRLQNIKE